MRPCPSILAHAKQAPKDVALPVSSDSPLVFLCSSSLASEHPELVVVAGLVIGRIGRVPVFPGPLNPTYHIRSLWIISHKIRAPTKPNRGARTNNGTEVDSGGVVSLMQVEGLGHGVAEVLEYVLKEVLEGCEKLGAVGRPLDENRTFICKFPRLP